jgi:LacI family transcriptional regulator
VKASAKRVAVLAPDQESYPTVMGVVGYGREHGGWNVFVELEADTAAFRRLRSWRGHGAIVHLGSRSKALAVRNLGIPAVNISSALQRVSVPRVTTDQSAIGELAARHLLERGFTRFAFVGIRGLWYSRLRRDGFQRCIEAEGLRCETLDVKQGVRSMLFWGRESEPLTRWLQTLTPPVGIMAAFDYLGAAIVQTCGLIGLRVPYDAAVIGTDNYLTVCESSEVPLTSVSRDWYRQGYTAAAVLDRLMGGRGPVPRETFIPPGKVVQRRSTDVLVTDCAELAPVVRYIQEHLAESFGTKALVRESGMSRRWLYTQFERVLGCTPYDYVMRLRIDRAKQMLARPELVPLREVARECGFTSERHLRAAMARRVGMAPSRYRRSGPGRSRPDPP